MAAGYAYGMAGVTDIRDMAYKLYVNMHDPFSSFGPVNLVDLGLVDRQDALHALLDDEITGPQGRFPTNLSGGLLARGHPLGAPILGTADTVRAISREDLYGYYRSRYTANRLIVSVAGHLRAGVVLAKLERLFSRRRRVAARRPRSERRPAPQQHVQVTSRRGLEQVHLCMGMAGPSQGSGRRFATHLLDIVLGSGMSSRLFQEVREKRGLVYAIGSSLNSYRLGGYETISAACAPRNVGRVLEVTLQELRKLKRGGVRPRELRWAKENLKGSLILALESTVSRMWERRSCGSRLAEMAPSGRAISIRAWNTRAWCWCGCGCSSSRTTWHDVMR
jgi:hypothetical protein